MMRIIDLEEILTSTRTRPVRIVVEKILAVRLYNRGSRNGPGSEILLEGGTSVRVAAPPEEVSRLMKSQ